jgi:hypothetical protein
MYRGLLSPVLNPILVMLLTGMRSAVRWCRVPRSIATVWAVKGGR